MIAPWIVTRSACAGRRHVRGQLRDRRVAEPSGGTAGDRPFRYVSTVRSSVRSNGVNSDPVAALSIETKVPKNSSGRSEGLPETSKAPVHRSDEPCLRYRKIIPRSPRKLWLTTVWITGLGQLFTSQSVTPSGGTMSYDQTRVYVGRRGLG